MKIHFLGTCAGTEPMSARKHSSTAFETDDEMYFSIKKVCSCMGY